MAIRGVVVSMRGAPGPSVNGAWRTRFPLARQAVAQDHLRFTHLLVHMERNASARRDVEAIDTSPFGLMNHVHRAKWLVFDLVAAP